jgi:hypothetical protein
MNAYNDPIVVHYGMQPMGYGNNRTVFEAHFDCFLYDGISSYEEIRFIFRIRISAKVQA